MAVFDGVHYVLSPSLPPPRRHDLASLLDLNGATSEPPHTHLVALAGSHSHSQTLQEQGQEQEREHEQRLGRSSGPGENVNEGQTRRALKVVSDRWVDRSVVMGKVQPEQYYSPDPAMIFSGVVACATDIPASDLEVLSAGVTALGGQWRIGLTRDVTHLFALRPGSDKYNTALHFAPHTHMMIVTPHWFDDSVRLGRRLPEAPYIWPDPLILRPGATLTIDDDVGVNADGKRKRKRTGEGGELEGEDGEKATANVSIESGGEKEKVWAGRKVLLSRSLELGDGSREAVEAGIRRAGGVVVRVPTGDGGEEAEERAVENCDVLVTRWRSGRAYFKAVRASILIGTLTWLFSVESSGTLHSPLDSLLWYPVPRGGITGLAGAEISITNYTGAARDYLKRLISLMGAKFTPSMSSTNKVLVAGFQPSPKTTRALSWSIPIVNHTWLEDCFVEWRALTVGLERYIVFPPGIDFGKVLMSSPGGVSASTGNPPVLNGGAVPGGRGVGVIDVDLEEARDATFSREIGAGEDGIGTHATVAQGDNKRNEDKERGRSEVKRNSNVPNAKKPTPPPPPTTRARSRSSRPASVAKTRSALGAFVDEVIEIPDDRESDVDDKPTRKRGRPKAGSAKPSPARRTPSVSSEKRKSPSKPQSSRTAPPGTSNSAREVEEAITLGLEDEAPLTAGEGVGRMDVDEDDSAPVNPKSPQKSKSKAGSEGKAKNDVKGKARRNQQSDGETSDDGMRVLDIEDSRPVKGKKLTAKSKPSPAAKAKPDARESSPPAVTYPSPYRAKPRLVRRSLASSTARKSDIESELEELEPGNKDGERPAKSGKNLSSTRKSKPTATKERELVRADSDSDLSSPPRRLSAATPVKNGMKPKPKPTPRGIEVEEEESDDEAYVRPVKVKGSRKGKEKETNEGEAHIRHVKAKGSKKGKEKEDSEDEDEAYIRPAKTKESGKGKKSEETKDKSKDRTTLKDVPVPKPKAKEVTTKTAPSLSPTRSPSPPPPPTGSLRTPKRTVSVLIPSLSKDYFTPGGSKVKDKDKESREKEQPAEPAQTSTTRATAAEASTSANKKAKPTPATTSGKLKSSSSKRRPRPEDSEAEVEENTSMVVDSPLTTSTVRGGPRRNAASKATTKLREEIMPDVVHYENERKKEKRRRSIGGESLVSMRDEEDEARGRVTKKRRIEEDNTKSKGKKTQSREEEDEAEEVEMQIIPAAGRAGKSNARPKPAAASSDGSENEETNERPTKSKINGSQDKKAGLHNKTQGSSRVQSKETKNVLLMTTGVTLSDDMIKGLAKLGVKMTTKPTECTHLIAKGIVRTEKFLCAMSVSPHVLTEQWAHDSISSGKILPEHDFQLSDPAAEKKWKFKFSEALERSKGSHGGSRLFKQMTFYVTPKVSVDSKLLKNIVTAAGGQVQTVNPTVRILKGKDNRYVISCAEDVSIWRPLAQEGYKIYSPELILQGVLKQKIEWENEECIVAG